MHNDMPDDEMREKILEMEEECKRLQFQIQCRETAYKLMLMQITAETYREYKRFARASKRFKESYRR